MTLANQQRGINLANGGTMINGSMQSAQVVTLKSGQQNASSVDSKSPMQSFDLRTSSTLPRCSRVTSNPEVEIVPSLQIAGEHQTMPPVTNSHCFPDVRYTLVCRTGEYGQ